MNYELNSNIAPDVKNQIFSKKQRIQLLIINADLHVCSTVLEPYSDGMVEAIDQFTEDRPD